MKKKMFALVMSVLMVFSVPFGVVATEVNGYDLQSLAEYYGVTHEELLNFSDNFFVANALAEAELQLLRDSSPVAFGVSNADFSHEVIIPISENIILTVTETSKSYKVDSLSRSFTTIWRNTFRTERRISNLLGINLVTLFSTGVFETAIASNGAVVSSWPVDAFTSHRADVGWVVSSTSDMSGPSLRPFVRNNFTVLFNLLGQPIQNASTNNTITLERGGQSGLASFHWS